MPVAWRLRAVRMLRPARDRDRAGDGSMPQHATDYPSRQHATQGHSTRITKRNCSTAGREIRHIEQVVPGFVATERTAAKSKSMALR